MEGEVGEVSDTYSSKGFLEGSNFSVAPQRSFFEEKLSSGLTIVLLGCSTRVCISSPNFLLSKRNPCPVP